MSSKGIFIKDIKPGMKVEGVFCVASKSLLETKAGAPYLSLKLADRTGEVDAKIWDNAVEADQLFEAGDFVYVQGVGQTWNSQVQLRINSVSPAADSEINTADFLPVAPIDLDEFEKQFDRLVRTVRRAPLAPFMKALFRKGGSTRAAFIKAPAAKKMHQAYIGGLLEHSVQVASLALQIAKLYPYLDAELLVAGALVHDIGKTEEFRYDTPPIDYTDRGRLIGHSAIGVEIIDRCAWETGIDTSHEDIMAIKHFILSHHGEREFGACVLPMTPEALVLHLIDDIDAKMSFLQELAAKVEDGTASWTPYQHLFERFFYLRNFAPDRVEASENRQGSHEGPEGIAKQPAIFNLD